MYCLVQVGAFQHHDKFFSTDAVKTVCDANTEIDDLRDALEYLVADGVTVNVIDLFEVIEIQEDEG